MITDGWSDGQCDRLLAYRESGDPADLTGAPIRSGNGASIVSIKHCREWRDHLRNHPDRSATDLDAHGMSTSTVRIHAYGHCEHPDHAAGEPADGRSRSGGSR